jgi:hypothetical protein
VVHAVTSGRQQTAQQPPRDEVDYRRFPARTVKAATRWFRQHDAGRGPWWFSCTGDGRFDLDPPDGTCYLADTAAATVRERIGPDLAAHRLIAASLLTGRVISALTLDTDRRAGDLDSNRASDRYGVTGELLTMTPYDVPRAWARVLHRAGFDAIKGRLRFSLSRTRGLSLFGPAGARDDWAVDNLPVDALTVARRMNLVLALPPDNEQLTIINPP